MKESFKQCFLQLLICCAFKSFEIGLFFSKDVKQKKEKTNFKKEFKNKKNTALTQEPRRDIEFHQQKEDTMLQQQESILPYLR